MTTEKCTHCERDFYPNQLSESKLHGGKVCQDCRADQGPALGEIIGRKKEQARNSVENRGGLV